MSLLLVGFPNVIPSFQPLGLGPHLQSIGAALILVQVQVLHIITIYFLVLVFFFFSTSFLLDDG